MLTNQTIEILKNLDKTELKKFGSFIKSPYFNTSKQLEKIFDTASKAYPEFNSRSLEFENMFKKLYPSEEYNEKRMKNLYSEFAGLLKKFIGLEEVTSVQEELDVFITKGLTDRGLNKISEKVIEKSFKDNDDGLLSITDKFHYLYRLNVHHSHNLGAMRMNLSNEYIKSDKALVEKLIIFFLADILQISFYDSMNHKIFKMDENEMLKTVYSSIDMEKILEYLSLTKHEYASFLKIQYWFIYYLENEITVEKYLELKKEMLTTIRKVKKPLQMQFIGRVIQIIITKLVPTDRNYYNDVLEFAELLGEFKIYPDENIHRLHDGTFRDIFISAIALKKYLWAEKFIDEYINYLRNDLKIDSENYCRGILSYNQGKYEESLSYLGRVRMKDIVEKITIKFYYLMNFIALQSYESALSALQSFRQFANESEEVTEMFAKPLSISLKYFAEIIKCEEKGGKMDEWLYKEAKETKGFYFKAYIIEKMEKLL